MVVPSNMPDNWVGLLMPGLVVGIVLVLAGLYLVYSHGSRRMRVKQSIIQSGTNINAENPLRVIVTREETQVTSHYTNHEPIFSLQQLQAVPPGDVIQKREEAAEMTPISSPTVDLSSHPERDHFENRHTAVSDAFPDDMSIISSSPKSPSLSSTNHDDQIHPHSFPPSYSSQTDVNTIDMQSHSRASSVAHSMLTEQDPGTPREGTMTRNSHRTSLSVPCTPLPLYEASPTSTLPPPSFHTLDNVTLHPTLPCDSTDADI